MLWEHVKARMGEYYEEKILKNLKNKMGEIEASFVNKTKILNRKKPKKTGDNSNTAKKNDNYSKTSDGKKKNHSKKKWQKEMPNQFGLVLLTLIQTIISIICYCLTLKGLAKKSCDT